MVAKTNYAATLKKLVAFTQTKFLTLAKIVGYDISYISKWSNGSKLPSSKYVEQINEELGHFFAKAILNNQKREAFCNTFSIPCDTQDLDFEISQLLSDAYRMSLKENPIHKSKEISSSIKVFTGRQDATTFISRLLENELQQLHGTGDLIILGEFCTLSDIRFWKLLENINLGASRLDVRVGLNLDKLNSDPKYMVRLYRTLNHFLNYDFVFYDFKGLEHANMIILKDHFVVQYVPGIESNINMCTYITDENLVQDIYEKTTHDFVRQKQYITPAKSLGMDEMGFRTAFYASNHFFFFLTNGFEFLLPREVFDHIIDRIHESKQPEENAYQVERLRITWEEFLGIANMEFMVPTTSILRYLETGYIYLTDIEYNLTPEERKDHFKSILDSMEKNPHITMGVLQSSAATTDYHGSNLSFYSNMSSGFFKKNLRYVDNDASSFYVISDKRLLDIIQVSFYRMKELPAYRLYSKEQIAKAYDTYQSLIERTLALSK